MDPHPLTITSSGNTHTDENPHAPADRLTDTDTTNTVRASIDLCCSTGDS